MSVKSGKNTIAVSYFQAALNRWVESSGRQKNELAAILDIAASSLGQYLKGIKVPSLAQMESIALKMGKDLPDILTEGRAILEGDAAPQTGESGKSAAPLTDREKKAYKAFTFVLQNQSDSHARMLITNIETYAAEKQGLSSSDTINPTDQKLSRSA